MKAVLFLVLVASAVSTASAYKSFLHPNCSYADIEGSWTFYEGERNLSNTAECLTVEPIRTIGVHLLYPNQAVDEFGNIGTWIMFYDKGFEVIVNGRSYFAFSYAEMIDSYFIRSLCNETYVGWSHDVTERHWSCFYGVKNSISSAKLHTDPAKLAHPENTFRMTNEHQERLVKSINNQQTLWKAKVYEQFNGKTPAELRSMFGGNSGSPGLLEPAPVTEEQRQRAAFLPRHWDWRDVDGVNYVSPVRSQGSCGACYAFAAMGMLEARLRIRTNNTVQTVLSTQDVIGCSDLVGGCNGGYAYIAGGRYAMDHGVVEEQCSPYLEYDSACVTNQECNRLYVSDYSFLGGYYGAGNEPLMQEALVSRGPIATGLTVYEDFSQYTGGIYHHVETSTRSSFYPFQSTNHVVVIVGYGEDAASGEKYWIGKNSWGDDWGEDGFFRIRRGVNEINIESDAFEASPIP